MKSIVLLLLILLSSLLTYSQEKPADRNGSRHESFITITNATSQIWSGGAPGQRGSIYSIEFTTFPNNRTRPDTIWIGTKCYPVGLYESEHPTKEGENCKLVKGKDKWTYSFYINQGEPSRHPSRDTLPEKKVVVKPKAPDYKGVAAISYTHNHKRKLETIASFKRLEPINYP